MTSSASDFSINRLLARFPALRRLAPPRRRIPVIQQLTATECGVSCLAMVLCYFGRETSREDARDVLGAGRGGTSARDLLTAARHYGLRGRGVRIELDAVRFLPQGSILHWGFNHFVVLERATAKGVEIIDPAIGRRLVPAAEAGKSFTGIALVLEPGDDFAPARGGAGWKGRLLGGLAWRSGDWGRILATSGLLLSLTAALPLFTGVLVDRVIPRADRHLLEVMLAGLGALIAFHLLASLVRAHLLLHLRTIIDVRMTLGLVEHLISLPYVFFQRRSAGDLLMRINSNAIIREVLTSGALSSVLDGLLIVLYTLLLFALDAVMGALVLAAGALQVGVFFATRRRRADVNAAVLAREARAQSYQVEMIGGIETLKAMGCEERAQDRWADLFVDVQNASLARGRLGAQVDAVSSTLRLAAPLAILAVGAHAVLRGDLSLGMMLAINTFAIGVFTPLANLVATAVQLQSLDTYLDRVLDICAAAPEQDRSRARPVGALRGRIELEDVSFRHGPLDPLVVEAASITIEPGQLVAIVGRSGSGKSSLASLLFGLYPPSAGRVLYDGIPLSELDLRSVRRRLGVVTQRVYLFSGSIRANIALADPDLPHDAVVRAAQRARIHDDIQALPMGYETLLVDGGGSLSGGQRQRIALARALAREPAILLLDEATSALDAITEREVQEELAALRCTRVVIAHRLSTIVRADLILVMDSGRVVERGTHDELLARRGLYAELVSTQLDGNAPA